MNAKLGAVSFVKFYRTNHASLSWTAGFSICFGSLKTIPDLTWKTKLDSMQSIPPVLSSKGLTTKYLESF